MRSGLVTLVLLALPVTACHWVFGYSPAATERDGRIVDGASGDGGPADGRRWDVTAPDASCGAVEYAPLPASPCASACTVTSALPDSDCDGLPDVHDPTPSDCSALVWSDSFLYPPTTWPSSWGRAYCNDDHERMTCGRLRFSFPPNEQTQDAWTTPGVPLKPTDLVEVHILPSTTSWHFGLVVATTAFPPTECYTWAPTKPWTPGASRQCTIAFQPGTLYLYNEVNDDLKGISSRDLAALPAEGFVLQSYVDGLNHMCRVYSGTTWIASMLGSGGSTLPDARLVRLKVTNSSGASSFDVDWVRAFR